jgi:ADP-L-glycero-D-manno-heptose 6-epimerase
MKRMKTPDGKFIVTGAAGFIGRNVVAALNARGHEDVIVVDRVGANKSNLDGLSYRDCIDKDDFRQQFLSDKLTRVDTVLHLGACSATTETNEKYMMDNNFLYTQQLCEWCLKNKVRFIYASSAATYGDGSLGYSDEDILTPRLRPLNVYGRSKQEFDMWALKNRLLNQIVGLKYFNVYGPYEDHKGDMRSVVNRAYEQILSTGEVKLFKSYRPEYKDGEQDRDFVYVKDAAKVTLFFHDHPKASGLFNCGTGKARTWIDLVKAVFSAMNRAPKITFVEMPKNLQDMYQYHTQAEVSKLRRAGYSDPFTSLEDGVRDYVQSYLAKKRTY